MSNAASGSIGRRAFITHSAGAVALSAALGLLPESARAERQPRILGRPVETSQGKVRGLLIDGIHVFRGIPYGAPTGGKGRFRPPRPAQPWTGVLDTLGWGADAPQGGRSARQSAGSNPYELIESDVSLQTIRSEDCLVLNVWTPETGEARKRPVMLWLHGGGFVSGSASRAVHDGGNLAQHGDVVVVSCNHRLNVLGYTFLDDIGGADFAGSGNVGMQDIILALTWIRENIARFGGDPENVTLFGYSGGGQKICTLMSMPSAKGLFHKAIVESGQNPRLLTREEATETTYRLLKQLGIGKNDIDALQAVPLDDLMRAYQAVWTAPPPQRWGFPARFSPVVDGVLIQDHPISSQSLALSSHIPLIIGSTREEMAAFTLMWEPNADTMNQADLLNHLAPFLDTKAQEVVTGYRRIHPAFSPWDLYTLITADWPTRMNSIRIAEARNALGAAPTFMYRVDWQTPVFGGRMKAPHGLEVPLAFRNVLEDRGLNGGGPDAFALSERVSDAWVAFARHGHPNTATLPWPPYRTNERETMLFDRRCHIAQDPGRDERLLLESAQI